MTDVRFKFSAKHQGHGWPKSPYTLQSPLSAKDGPKFKPKVLFKESIKTKKCENGCGRPQMLKWDLGKKEIAWGCNLQCYNQCPQTLPHNPLYINNSQLKIWKEYDTNNMHIIHMQAINKVLQLVENLARQIVNPQQHSVPFTQNLHQMCKVIKMF